MADFDFNALPPEEQAKFKNMYLLNQAQGALASPGYQPDMSQYEFKKPDNVGQALGNVVKNRVINPVQEAFGYREPMSDVLNKMRIGQFQQEMSQNRVEALSAQQLRNVLINTKRVDPATAQSLDYETLQSIVTSMQGPVQTDVYGNTYTVNPLTGERTAGTAAPTSVQEYKYGVSQIPSASETVVPFKPAEIPSYFDRQDELKRGVQSKPSAVQTFEFLMETNPALNNLSGQEKQDLLFKIIRQDPDTASKIAKGQVTSRNGGLFLTPAQQRVDELFAANISAFRFAGGQTASLSRAKELDEIIAALESAEPGQITGQVLSLTPRRARPDVSVNTQDRVEKLITEGLRQTLGAQFTESEAAAFIARSYNIMLPESVNADRLKRVRAAMRQTTDAMVSAGVYYDKKGSLQGYEGLPALKDVEAGLYKISDYAGITNEQLMTRIDDPSISRDEFDVLLRVAQMRKIK